MNENIIKYDYYAHAISFILSVFPLKHKGTIRSQVLIQLNASFCIHRSPTK